MKQIGKRGRKWLAFRREYLKGKATHEGFFQCELCGRYTTNPDLDHIKKRGSHPDLVFEESNIRLLCRSCHMMVT